MVVVFDLFLLRVIINVSVMATDTHITTIVANMILKILPLLTFLHKLTV